MPIRRITRPCLAALLASLGLQGTMLAVPQARTMAPAGDVDADGRADLIIRCFRGIAVYSGANGAVLHWLEEVPDLFERDFCGAGDLNGDGHADVAAALVDAGVRVWSGKSGEVLLTVAAPEGVYGFGTVIRPAGDVDLDGTPDLLVAAPAASLGGLYANGGVWLVRGSDGAVLATFFGSESGDECGRFLGCGSPGAELRHILVGGKRGATAYILRRGVVIDRRFLNLPYGPDPAAMKVNADGDVDGDGCVDLILCWKPSEKGPIRNGDVQVLSGRDGALLHLWRGEEVATILGYGTSAAFAGDVNGDGFGDVVVGSPDWKHPGEGHGSGKIEIFSGRDGSTLLRVEGRDYSDGSCACDCDDHGFSNCYNLGLSVAAFGDIDGDRSPEVLVHFDVLRKGSVLAVSARSGEWLLEGMGPLSFSYTDGRPEPMRRRTSTGH